MTRASLVGLLSPRRPHEFEVTPKGATSEPKGLAGTGAMTWHLSLAGLLLLGIANGVRQALTPNPLPGLSVSLGWAGYNMRLIGVAVITAREHRQLRGLLRRDTRLPCWLVDGNEQTEGEIVDVSESGASLRLPDSRYSLDKDVRIILEAAEGELVAVIGQVVRQEVSEDGSATLGVAFEDPGEAATRALIAKAFASIEAEPGAVPIRPGIVASFVSLVSVLGRARERLVPSRRRTPRLPFERPCRLRSELGVLEGTTRDVSFAGAAAVFEGSHPLPRAVAVLEIDDVELGVRVVESETLRHETRARFVVEAVVKGARRWRDWHRSSPR
jgi:hypothetical protein